MEEYTRAVGLICQGELMEASNVLRSACLNHEEIPLDVLLVCGMGFYGQGYPDQAVIWLEMAVQVAAEGSNPERMNMALGWLGLAYLEQGLMEKAAAIQAVSRCEDCRKAVSLALFRARWLAVHGDRKGASALYKAQLNEQLSTFDTVLVLLERGRVHHSGGAFTSAAEDWQRAAKLAALLGDRLLLAWCRKAAHSLGAAKDNATGCGLEHPVLCFTLFGDFAVRRGQEQLSADSFSRRKALTLLQYLVLQPRYRIARERALELLWGEDADANNLHVTIHALRRDLNSGLAQVAPYIILRGGTVALNQELVAGSDAQQFRSFIQAGRACWETDRAKAADCYRQAGNLYKGELLANAAPDPWVVNVRESYLQMYLEALTRVAEVSRDSEEELNIWLEVLEWEPGHERAVREVMLLLARCGRINKALSYYQRYALFMEREMGLPLAPEVKRLYDELRRGTGDDGHEA